MSVHRNSLIQFLAAPLLLVVHATPAYADSTDAPSPLSGTLIRYENLEPLRLSFEGDVIVEMAALEYIDGELPLVHVDDFNGDGVSDYLMGTPEWRLCGTAGCPYVLLDGESLEKVGDFFGTVAVLVVRVNGSPVIQTISKRNVDTTNLHTFVFDGESYRIVSYALLESAGVEAWHRGLDASR